MNLIRKCFLILVILGFYNELYSQENKETLKLSIIEAQTYALQNNRAVQSAKLDIEIANKKVWETTAIGLPQLNFATNYQHQFTVPEVSFGSYLDPNALPAGVPITQQNIFDAYRTSPPIALGVKNNTTFDITVSQLIFSGEYLVGLQAMKVLKQVSLKTLVKTEAQTKESVATSYYLVLTFGENIKVLDETLKAVDQTYNDMVKMNQQGFTEETDLDQIKINRSNIQTLITSLSAQKEISMKLLKYQLGVDFNQSITLTDSLPRIIEQGNIQYLSLPEFDINNSVDYQMVSNLERISALMLKREQSKYLPTIAAFYRHQEQAQQASFNFAVKDVAGLSLSLPIFTSGQRNATVGQARLDLQKARLNKENAEQGLIVEFETALSDYQTAYSNFNTNKESMTLSKKIYDKTIIKYREGVSSNFELTQNQNQFLIAETNYYSSVFSLLNAKAKLDRILNKSEQ